MAAFGVVVDYGKSFQLTDDFCYLWAFEKLLFLQQKNCGLRIRFYTPKERNFLHQNGYLFINGKMRDECYQPLEIG